MLRATSTIPSPVLLAGAALSLLAAGGLLGSCSQVVSAWADPESLTFAPEDFEGTGALTRTTTVCYNGPGQVAGTAVVPSPFSLVSGEAGEGATTASFTLAQDGCQDLVVALAAPADLDERLEITVAGEVLHGTVVVALHSSAPEGSGDGGATDGGGADGGGTDGGGDGGGADGGGGDGGGSDGGGGGDDTGEPASPCPAYSGLATTRVRTYETTATYTSASGISGTQTLRVDATDPAAPVLVVDLSLTNSLGDRTVTTEHQRYVCDGSGSTLVGSEVEGSLIGSNGVTTPITRVDTYEDGMISMVPAFGKGGNVSDTFQLERVEDGPPQTIYGSNVVTASGSTTTATPAGSYPTIRARISYAAGSETLDDTAYLDEELGMVASTYWELVGLE